MLYGLMPEVEFASVVSLPRKLLVGKATIIRDRPSGSILSHPGSVYDYAAIRQALRVLVVPHWILIPAILNPDVRLLLFHHRLQVGEPGLRSIDHEKPLRPVSSIMYAHQMKGDRHAGAAGAETQHMTTGPPKVVLAEDDIQAKSGSQRV